MTAVIGRDREVQPVRLFVAPELHACPPRRSFLRARLAHESGERVLDATARHGQNVQAGLALGQRQISAGRAVAVKNLPGFVHQRARRRVAVEQQLLRDAGDPRVPARGVLFPGSYLAGLVAGGGARGNGRLAPAPRFESLRVKIFHLLFRSANRST